MITVSVELKPASLGGKVKSRAVIGHLNISGYLVNKRTYTAGVPKNLGRSLGNHFLLDMSDLAEDLATGYLIAQAPDLATGELDDGTPHFGNAECVYHKGAYLVLFDEAEEKTHAMYK